MIRIEEVIGELNGEDAKEKHGLPPGFRFHPTDEELIAFYLASKIFDLGTFHGVNIAEVDLNRCEPWELPGTYIDFCHLKVYALVFVTRPKNLNWFDRYRWGKDGGEGVVLFQPKGEKVPDWVENEQSNGRGILESDRERQANIQQ